MLWYIIAILSIIGSFIPKSAFAISESYDAYVIFFRICIFIFILVSVWTTIASIYCQKNDYIGLERKKNTINDYINCLKAKNKEFKEMTNRMFSHELEIIQNIFPNNDNTNTQNFTDNILSKNLLATIPKSESLPSISLMINKMDSIKENIIYHIISYNQLIHDIKRRQNNTLIYSPFVPKYYVFFIEIESLDNLEETKIKKTEDIA